MSGALFASREHALTILVVKPPKWLLGNSSDPDQMPQNTASTLFTLITDFILYNIEMIKTNHTLL